MSELTPRQLRQGRFWRKYLRLSRAGVPTLRALEIIREEETSAFQEIVGYLHDRMSKGHPLSEAMKDRTREFSLSACELIRTAEKEGRWDLVLEELAEGLLEGTFD